MLLPPPCAWTEWFGGVEGLRCSAATIRSGSGLDVRLKWNVEPTDPLRRARSGGEELQVEKAGCQGEDPDDGKDDAARS